jgi:inhibitor of KinA
MLLHNRITLEPLGDQAVLATFDDEGKAARFAAACRELQAAWLIDVVLAYVSVAVFYDSEQLDYRTAEVQLGGLRLPPATPAGRLHVIPCCYERQLDLQRVAQFTQLPPDEVIRLHMSVEYSVYAIGFCPGFPYLGYLLGSLQSVPRLEKPRLRVEPGSVGLTGKQTGIYPLPRPGGWNLIGQTPLELVNVRDGYFPIRAGDRVRFQRIDEPEYERLRGERLQPSHQPLAEARG